MPTSGNAQQLSLWPGIGHRNHYLFSDYYLNARLPTLPLWHNPPGLSAAFADLKNLWASTQDNITTAKEPQTREYLIDPVLRILGHIYEPEPSLPTDHSVKAPDYAIFTDRNSMSRAVSQRGNIDYFRHAVAIAEAKRYGRPLDRKSREGADPFDNNNPNFQVDYYLRTTGLRWGILTDGRYWRLYNRDTSFKLNSYYEVDLVSLIEQSNEQAFKYLYLFFRREAFSGIEKRESFLDQVFEESARYATAVGSKLKDAVYEALETLCEGFVRFQRNNLDSRLQLNDIYDNSLVLLYRLLFIFYAESRGLLPLGTNRSYSDNYSLNHLKEGIAKRIDDGAIIPPDWINYWSQLKALFKAINEGSPAIDVYEYNGGLFDPDRHQFLEQYDIGDLYLAKAIDLFARADTEPERKRDFVDYRDLAIQHLGSIYEGLLEHKPRVADEEMVIIREKGKEKIIPRTELKGQRVYGQKPKGEIYLTLEKGERKATGSYYTPDYIVKYIVENTLEPLAREKVDAWHDRIAKLETKVKAARGENRQLLEKEIENTQKGLTDEILSLKVLDPAMGSGHFLVRATEYLAEELATNPNIPPSSRDGAIEDIDYWKRRVVEHCIYGVDINPLAVELAKVSLWLSTVAKNKPLSFLDHHLRCGNSLLGARLEDLERLPMKKEKKTVPSEQLALFDKEAFTKDIGLSVGDVALIETLPSDTINDIKKKDRIFKELVELRRLRYRKLADLWVSRYFGNEMDEKLYNSLVLLIQGKESQLPPSQAHPYLDKAESLAKQKHFFHWELEFPEVFFNRNGQRLVNPGFDAVVGNPPWIRVSGIDDVEDNFMRNRFETLFGHFDLYIGFIQLEVDLLRQQGYLGLITPNKFLVKRYANRLRPYLLDHCRIVQLIDISKTKVFPEAAGYPLISIFERTDDGSDANEVSITILPEEFDHRLFINLANVKPTLGVQLLRYSVRQGDFRSNEYSTFDVLMNPAEKRLTTKVEKVSVTLRQLAQLLTGTPAIDKFYQWDDLLFNESELSNQALAKGEYLRFIVAGSVRSYCIDWDIPIRAVKKDLMKPYLKFHAKAVGDSKWLVFHLKKIVIRGNDTRLTSAYDDTPFANLSLYSVVFHEDHDNLNKTMFLLALLNSKLLTVWYRKKFGASNISGGYITFNAVYLEQLPIRRINFITPQAERERLVAEGKSLYQKFLQRKDRGEVLSFVSKRLPQEPDGTPDIEHEQSDVVHDLLAFLAEEMTRLHKEKQVEIKGFLNWLQVYLGINIEGLKNKTKIKEYYNVDVEWEGFLGALEQNRKAIQLAKGVDITRREPQETIRAEFDASVDKLKPILEAIELTDKLIDQVVYKLYSLIEAEIAVVEGRS
jgi:hypothetical protein